MRAPPEKDRRRRLNKVSTDPRPGSIFPQHSASPLIEVRSVSKERPFSIISHGAREQRNQIGADLFHLARAENAAHRYYAREASPFRRRPLRSVYGRDPHWEPRPMKQLSESGWLDRRGRVDGNDDVLHQ